MENSLKSNPWPEDISDLHVPEGQPKHMSWLEAIAGTAIGYLVALATQLVIFPILGIAVSLSQNILIGAIFTVISVIRGYLVRRLFNWMQWSSK